MKTTQEIQKLRNQKRSGIKSCIIESWKVFAQNTKSFFKYLWLHLFIAGLGFALFTAISCKFYTEHIQSTLAYIDSGYDATLAKALFAPSTSSLLILIVAFLAFILSYYLMNGAIFSQIRFYNATDSLPMASPFTFWGEIRKDAKKTFIFDLILFAVVAICSAIITFIAWLTNWWVMILLVPVIIYWSIIGFNGRLQYVLGNLPLKEALKNAFTTGHRKFGGFFILFLLTSIPLLFISYVALLPTAIIQMSYSADMISRLAGDPSGMPPYVLPLYIGIATFSFALLGIGYILQQWPIAFFTSAHSTPVQK